MLQTLFFISLQLVLANAKRHGDSGLEIVHEWVTVDYDFPPFMKTLYIGLGLFIPQNVFLVNLDAYNGEIFVQADREHVPGVPSSVNRVIKKNGISLLQPFPNLKWNRVGDCKAIQCAKSLEIDSTTGYLWIVDRGIVNRQKFCPQKLVVIDINTKKEVFRHVFPNSVTPPESILFDLALDREHKKTRYAYMPDSVLGRLVVVDVFTDASWVFDHPSMKEEPSQENITVNGETITSRGTGGINGVATTSDFKFFYYFSIASFKFWQIPTFVLRNPAAGNDVFNRFAHMIGTRPGHAVGMTSGTSSLFFPSLESNTILKWDRKMDVRSQSNEKRVHLTTQIPLAQDDIKLNFADGLDVEDGYLWYLANKLQKQLLGTMDFSGNDGSNFVIGRIFVGESSYLNQNKDCS